MKDDETVLKSDNVDLQRIITVGRQPKINGCDPMWETARKVRGRDKE